MIEKLAAKIVKVNGWISHTLNRLEGSVDISWLLGSLLHLFVCMFPRSLTVQLFCCCMQFCVLVCLHGGLSVCLPVPYAL